MARPPIDEASVVERYGPHLKYEPPGGWQSEAQNPAEKLVQTHCCFCGQQCEIQLKVRNNEVIGFEPWEEFPFNRGMLCPKGVKRYMQSSHPDRLLLPLMRDDSGFRPASWNDALALTARRLRDIQERYGRDAVAVYGGASLTTEKAYLLGKFARIALGTRHIDYNGRLCMVSAGVAYKLAFGVDRSPNPWSDFPVADVMIIAGSNTAECSPITTDYVWRFHDRGGKLIVIDPRMTPNGLENRSFIENHTTGFDAVAESAKPWDPATAGHITGVPPDAIEKAAHWFAAAERGFAMRHLIDCIEEPVIKAYVAILSETGLRKREGLSLKWEHINLGQRVLAVQNTKSRKPRYIYSPVGFRDPVDKVTGADCRLSLCFRSH